MTMPYRESAPPIPEPVVIGPRGIVRAGGARCSCTPPGLLWCWWFKVQKDDRWYCVHGGAWKRARDYAKLFLHAWESTPSEGEER